MFATTELVPLLHERGIDLSASQVHRLVTGTRNGCRCRCWPRCATSSPPTPAELITTDAANVGVRKTAGGNASTKGTCHRPASQTRPHHRRVMAPNRPQDQSHSTCARCRRPLRITAPPQPGNRGRRKHGDER